MRRRNIYRPKEVLEVCFKLASNEEGAKERKRGRPPVYSDEIYISLALFKTFFNLTLRDTIAVFQDIFPEKPCPSFQALFWFLKTKLSSQRLKALFKKLRKVLKPLLPQEEPIFILDTTGITFRGKTQRLKWLRGELLKEARGHSRFCSLIGYFRKTRLLVIEGVEVGLGYASDVKLGLEVLKDVEGEGWLLGDGGFDSISLIKEAEARGLKPIIKLKGGGEVKDRLREGVKRRFDTTLYRLRSIAEGIFGGLKTKMNGPLHCLDIEIARKGALLEALAYNLRIYLSLFLLFYPIYQSY
jgi:hypothetical protein